MLASSAVISGLVICPVDIREVKLSNYDYIRGSHGELQGIGGGHLGVDNKMQCICICFVQSKFLSKLFHNLSLNFEGVQL